MIQRPVSIMMDDFKCGLKELINGSGLAPCLLEPIVQNVYLELHSLAERQLQIEKARYDEQIKEEDKKT